MVYLSQVFSVQSLFMAGGEVRQNKYNPLEVVEKGGDLICNRGVERMIPLPLAINNDKSLLALPL